TVVMAAGGYPGGYATGAPIFGITEAEAAGCRVFHAGTALNTAGQVVTAGGRVLAVTGVAPTLTAAAARAYDGAARITFEGAHYRRDIAASLL
ncbi:MAG: phosphoribosylglycinamide synthetase C domain-containing protein, partial [Caldilineaceae bacterium]